MTASHALSQLSYTPTRKRRPLAETNQNQGLLLDQLAAKSRHFSSVLASFVPLLETGRPVHGTVGG